MDKIAIGLFMLFVIACVFCVFGVIGSFTWPYTINTWVEYSNQTQETEGKPIGAGHGFLLGMIPGVGQLSIPAAVITGVCDVIFIPDD